MIPARTRMKSLKNLKIISALIYLFLIGARGKVETVPSGDAIKIGPHVRLPSTYDVQVLPSTPVHVNVSLLLFKILSVNEPKQTISLLLGFKMVWMDSRIIVDIDKYKEYALLVRDQRDNFWFPDLYVLNSKDVSVPTLTLDPTYLRLFEDGAINYSISKEVKTVCPMNFIDYPVDIQRCDITFESWSSPKNEMILNWNKFHSWVNPNLNSTLNKHTVDISFLKNKPTLYGDGKEYSSLSMRLTLTRKIEFHMMRVYLPSILLILIAGISMLIPITFVPARATISMTALLTLAGMFGNLSSFTPQISYTTKLDNWMVASMIFVFSTLLELVVLLVYKMYLKENMAKIGQSDTWATKSGDKQKKPAEAKDLNAEDIDKKMLFVEKCLTAIYFSMFLIYCLAYWLAILRL